jgi:acid phosphatase family membrane protein YuiD
MKLNSEGVNMNFFTDLFNNRIFLSGAAGWLIAQILKTFIHMLLTKEFVSERLIGSGGMPSSHSATVCALATAVCYERGARGFEFAMAFIFAVIVMYDAMGVRRETGIQAKLLNNIIKTFEDMGHSKISAHDKLKEFVGHSPLQVLAGAILGILIAVLMYVGLGY